MHCAWFSTALQTQGDLCNAGQSKVGGVFINLEGVLSSYLFFHLSVSSKTCIRSDSSSPVINKKKESSKDVGVVYL